MIKDDQEILLLELDEKLQEILEYKHFIIIGTEFGNIYICDIQDEKNPKYIKFSNKSNRIKSLKVAQLEIDYLIIGSSDGKFNYFQVI